MAAGAWVQCRLKEHPRGAVTALTPTYGDWTWSALMGKIDKLLDFMATLVHLCVVPGCCPATVAELSVCGRDHLVRKASNIYCLSLCRESLPFTGESCLPMHQAKPRLYL